MANAEPPRKAAAGEPDRDSSTQPPRLALRRPEPRAADPQRATKPPLLAPPGSVPRPLPRGRVQLPPVRVPPPLPRRGAASPSLPAVEKPIEPAIPIDTPGAPVSTIQTSGTQKPDWDFDSDAPTIEQVAPRAQRRGFLLVAVAIGVLAGVVAFGALTSGSSTPAARQGFAAEALRVLPPLPSHQGPSVTPVFGPDGGAGDDAGPPRPRKPTIDQSHGVVPGRTPHAPALPRSADGLQPRVVPSAASPAGARTVRPNVL
jgi:hypothetical protein